MTETILRMASLHLRPFTLNDVNETYRGWLLNPEVNQFLEVRHHNRSIDALQVYVSRVIENPDHLFFIIVPNALGEPVGTASLHIDRQYGTSSLGFMIGNKDYWGGNFPLEGLTAILDHGFFDCGLRRIADGCYAPNMGMQFIFKRLGFTKEGVRRLHYLDNEGTPVDELLFGIFKDEWIERRRKYSNLMPEGYRPELALKGRGA